MQVVDWKEALKRSFQAVKKLVKSFIAFEAKSSFIFPLSQSLVCYAGPGADDSYADLRSDYQKNEVAVDYNAGFQGMLLVLASADILEDVHSPEVSHFVLLISGVIVTCDDDVDCEATFPSKAPTFLV